MGGGQVEWAGDWPLVADGSYSWYCNTIPTPDGGTHETGLRAALTKGIRAFGELAGQKRAAQIQPEDIMSACEIMLSVFVRDPEFQSKPTDSVRSEEHTSEIKYIMRISDDVYCINKQKQQR